MYCVRRFKIGEIGSKLRGAAKDIPSERQYLYTFKPVSIFVQDRLILLPERKNQAFQFSQIRHLKKYLRVFR